MTAETVIRLAGVSKAFSSGAANQLLVLDRVDLEIARGRFVVVIGRSGSGKSTLLNLVGAMDRPDTGRIYVDGFEISAMGERERTGFRRTHLGFIFQSYNLLPTLNVRENVDLPLSLNRRSDEDRVDRLLAHLGLADKAEYRTSDLSGGEQQRVAIARALVHRPSLVLADEPTGNLDLDTARQTIELLNRTVRDFGQTLLMATHSREAIPYADQVLRIDKHKIIDATGD